MSETPFSGPELSPNRRAWARFVRNRAAGVGGAVLILVTVAVLIGPFLPSRSAFALSEAQFAAPSWEHWFGTDVHGRDLFLRVLHGGRISLLVGVVGACVSLVIGVTWGATAGYMGGRVDAVLMRTVDVLYSLPSIVLVIVLIATLEARAKGMLSALGAGEVAASARMAFLFVGLGAVSWLNMARIVRGQVLSLRTRAFVDASRALGGSVPHILRRHILPNVLGLVITYLTLTLPAVVLYESFLSYLGLGVQPPQASLGSLIAEGAAQINPIRTYWWMILFPAGTLTLTLLALNFLGDGLRDAFDPRSAR
jgi:peptide/nickel transport system permease protein/oligopeptide transport system permease protein